MERDLSTERAEQAYQNFLAKHCYLTGRPYEILNPDWDREMRARNASVNPDQLIRKGIGTISGKVVFGSYACEVEPVDLDRAVLDIFLNGPKRMVVDDGCQSTAVPADVAGRSWGVVPTVVFIRGDGWSLGAPKHLEQKAEALGKPEGWAVVIRDFQFKLRDFRASYF